MQLLNPTRNIAARMGRWSASHRKVAIFGWLAFVIAAIAIGSSVGMKTIDQQNQNVGQAHRADQILKQAGFGQSGPLTEIVVIQSNKLTIHDPAFQAAVSRRRDDRVAPSRSDPQPALAAASARTALRSRSDGHTALVEWDMSGTLKSAEKRIDPLTRAVVGGRQRVTLTFYVGEAGVGQLRQGARQAVQRAARPGGHPVGPADAADLVLVFGSLLAACVPLMLALAVGGRDGRAGRTSSATSRRWTRASAPSCCWSGSRSASTTRCSISSASARSGQPATAPGAALAGGRRDLGSLGADLGRDRDDRDGRDAVLRRQDVQVLLDRDDDRRRGRDDRLAHRAAGAPVKARRSGREGTDPAARPAPAPGRREPGLVRDPHPGALSVRPCPRSCATGLLVAMAIPTLHLHTAQSGCSHCRAAPRRSRRSTGSRPRSRASRARPSSRSRPRPTPPRSGTAVAQLQAQAAASGLGYGAVQVDTNRSHTAARISIPLPRQRRRRDLDAARC